jgi:FlaA1/EpsC-like NDP-sugar epimerase
MARHKIVLSILAWPRWFKRYLAVAVDVCLCVFTLWLAFAFRLNTWEFLSGIQLLTIPVSIGIAIPLFIVNGLYRAIFRFIGWAAFMAIIRAVSIYGAIFAVIFAVISVPGIPRTVGLLQPMLLLLAVAISRLLARQVLGSSYRSILRQNEQTRTMIYGAGAVGRQLASALRNGGEFSIAGFLDEDRSLHGTLIDGIKVYDPENLRDLTSTMGVKTVLLAIPNISPEQRKAIIEKLRGGHVAVRNLPNVSDLARGRVRVSDFEDLAIDDLLGRPAVPPSENLMRRNVEGKVVMVTGAGGSIGSELCRQILQIGPKTLVLLEMNEFALYSIFLELSRMELRECRIVPLLGSVRDRDRMEEVIGVFRPDTIYHAAAYKHVPLVEQNLVEGISNNVFGTIVTASVARQFGVSSFVLISTDKAVRPTNVMGASKRIAELVLQAFAAEGGGTVFSMVRFGNVLGSSGSVVPLFRQQIAAGGPITLTHPEVTRFFMTIPEASQLVIQAGAMAQGGDVFVLNMGEPVKIIDLARSMVELSGLTVRDEDNPDGDIEFVMTGLRPAEKLYEELLLGNNPQPTEHQRIMKAEEEFLHWPELEAEIRLLEAGLKEKNLVRVNQQITKLVSGYRHDDDFSDLTELERKVLEAGDDSDRNVGP